MSGKCLCLGLAFSGVIERGWKHHFSSLVLLRHTLTKPDPSTLHVALIEDKAKEGREGGREGRREGCSRPK